MLKTWGELTLNNNISPNLFNLLPNALCCKCSIAEELYSICRNSRVTTSSIYWLCLLHDVTAAVSL